MPRALERENFSPRKTAASSAVMAGIEARIREAFEAVVKTNPRFCRTKNAVTPERPIRINLFQGRDPLVDLFFTFTSGKRMMEAIANLISAMVNGGISLRATLMAIKVSPKIVITTATERCPINFFLFISVIPCFDEHFNRGKAPFPGVRLGRRCHCKPGRWQTHPNQPLIL